MTRCKRSFCVNEGFALRPFPIRDYFQHCIHLHPLPRCFAATIFLGKGNFSFFKLVLKRYVIHNYRFIDRLVYRFTTVRALELVSVPWNKLLRKVRKFNFSRLPVTLIIFKSLKKAICWVFGLNGFT